MKHFTIVLIIIISCYYLYADSSIQEEPTTGIEPLTDMKHEKAFIDTTQPRNLSSTDTVRLHLYKKYLEFKHSTQKLLSLYKKATEEGYTIPQEEINIRLAVYRKTFPGVTIDSTIIIKELFVNKYLQEKGEHTIDEDRMKEVYDDLVKLSPFDSIPSFEVLKPILTSNALFSRDYVIMQRKYEMELRRIRNQERFAEATAPWPQDKIKLEGPEDMCLATLIEDDSCVVTLGEFNQYLSFMQMPRQILLDTARIYLLRKLLSDKFLAAKARMSGTEDKKHINDKIKQQEENVSLYKSISKMGTAVTDPNVLWEVYKRNFNDLFRAYEKVTLDIIGSTDSLWIDSIYQIVTNSGKKKFKNKEKNEGAEPRESVPWFRCDAEHLPEAILVPTDTLNEGELTAPIKTPFGFFICRVARLDEVRQVTFQQAQNKLVYLATKEKYIGLDSLINEKAYAFYQKYSTRFKSPDTLTLKTWLVPNIKETKDSCNPIGDSTRDISTDTLSFRSITVSSVYLPDEVRGKLEKRLGNKPKKSVFLGPIQGKYGIWYYRITQVKRGGIPVPFEVVKGEIIESLVGPYCEVDTTVLEERVKQLKFESGLAKAYLQQCYLENERLSDDDIRMLIDRSVIDISHLKKNLHDHAVVDHARDIYNDKINRDRQNNIAEWIASIAINKESLFQ